MKKILTILLLTLWLVPYSFAQVKFGVETGMNLSHYKTSSRYQAQKKGGMEAGFQLGGTVDYTFCHHWLLISGASFIQTQSKMELADYMNFYFPNTKIKQNHIVVPLKVGYNFHLGKKFSLVPFIGIYGSYNFSAGKCPLDIAYPSESGVRIEKTKWNPMKGYSYIIPNANLPYDYEAKLSALRHWTYGGTGGIKAIIADHYTISFSYYEAIKKVQKQCSLRNYGYQLSVGYQF